jgi:hypothetical protein
MTVVASVIHLNNKSKLFSTETITGEGVYEDARYSRIIKVADSADGSPNLKWYTRRL